jgi:hypothetical protein
MDTGSHAVLGPQAHTNSVSYLTPATTVKGDEQLVSVGFDGWVCLWEPRQVRGIKPHLIARWVGLQYSTVHCIVLRCYLVWCDRVRYVVVQQSTECGEYRAPSMAFTNDRDIVARV